MSLPYLIIFVPSGLLRSSLCGLMPVVSLSEFVKDFLLDKVGFFYLRWGVYEALRKYVQGKIRWRERSKEAKGKILIL